MAVGFKKIHIALLAASVVLASGQAEPSLPDNLIARPKFIKDDWNFEAGTAFFLKSKAADKGYIVTAHHLFGPMGGLEKEIPPAGLKDVVTSIQMSGISKPWSKAFQVHPIPIAGNPGITSENPFYSKHVDLAIFATDLQKGVHWGTLSSDTLKIGDKVWQAGEPRSGQAPGQFLHRCKIIKVTRGHGFCLFDNQELVLGGTSGSPYLNSKGEIIGLHSGSTKEPRRLTGIILRAEIIRQALP